MSESSTSVRLGVPIYLCLGLAFGGFELSASTLIAERQPQLHVLLIAISSYAPETGWQSIHSDNDVTHLRAALEQRGLATLTVLSGPAATRTGIEEAVRDRLLDSAQPGDVVVLAFSGHGQQVTDDDGDELDGYDEAIVPYDAPRTSAGGYHGERHLRDDTVNLWVWQLQEKVGKRGNVVVLLDSCFSGTPRGEEDTVFSRWRGGAPPIGLPRAQASGRDEAGGFWEPARRRGDALRDGPVDEAPYVVFSAASHDEVAWETRDEQGRPVGSLSYAFAQELSTIDAGATYRTLFERVEWKMAARVKNRPQVDGEVDVRLFAGTFVAQNPFVRVSGVEPDGRHLTLAAGSLVGLRTGARIEIHRAGAASAEPETLLAHGEVEESSLLEARVELDEARERREILRGRAFVTAWSFSGPRVRVRLAAGVEPRLAERLRERWNLQPATFEEVDDGADVVVAAAGTEPLVEVYTEDRRVPILPPTPATSDDLPGEITRLLLDLARNRYFRGLALRTPELDVKVEMVPVQATGCPRGRPSLSECDITRLPLATKRRGEGKRIWNVGDLFQLRVTNRGRLPAHLSVLDLTADGRIGLYWPEPRHPDPTPLPPGKSRELPVLYEITEPLGTEVVWLLATESPIDLRPFVSAEGVWPQGETRGTGAHGPLGPLAALLDGVGAKGEAHFETGASSTSAIVLTVEPRGSGTEARRARP